ncbi:MAG: sigma-70 family RNA polymerase sigma factor [Oscillospiraceae bacterium]|nr:sigma-70 family RNA polymerase sigma factor [Oscillospiraceae bacterium]
MRTEYSDEALVAMIQKGAGRADKTELGRAYTTLLERMLPVIHARADLLAGRSGGSCSREDLTQEGMLGFLSAISAYKPGRGASFRTFAGVCVGNRVISALRRGAAPTAALDEAGIDAALAAASDPQDIFLAMETTRRIMEVIQENLSALERGAMEAYLAGERYEEIARRLEVPVKAVDNALQRVRKKLKEFL